MVDILLKQAYQECLGNLSLLDNREMVARYIIPKVDEDKPVFENKVINYLQTLPVASLDAIIDLATSGYVKKHN